MAQLQGNPYNNWTLPTDGSQDHELRIKGIVAEGLAAG